MGKRNWKTTGAILVALALFVAACGGAEPSGTTASADTGASDTTATSAAEVPEVVIGAQDFGESAILGEIYGQVLVDSGYSVSQQALGGFRDIQMGAFEGDDINFAPEYAASMLEFINGPDVAEATGDAAETTEILQGYLDDLGLVAFTPSDAIDTNAFVVTQETSEELGLTSLSDLAGDEGQITLGGPPDCETNPFCMPGLQDVYGVDLSASFRSLDAGAVTVQALEAGEINVAVLFSTNGVIAEQGWVLLEDDQNMLAADNVVPVVSSELAEAGGEDFRSIVDEVSAALTTEALTEMNRLFDIERQDADAIATDWLTENGLVEG
ncbi:MAG: hypothetical protein GEU79_00785 [Acidimicrobiia bacterium]|nr:hypothetical protein [Acidimicrobiia bacterium]